MELREEIERIAREIYFEHGCVPGHDLDNWLQAEEIVLSRLEPDCVREEHIGKHLEVHARHVIDPTEDTVTS
jgi:hypothetical protein